MWFLPERSCKPVSPAGSSSGHQTEPLRTPPLLHALTAPLGIYHRSQLPPAMTFCVSTLRGNESGVDWQHWQRQGALSTAAASSATSDCQQKRARVTPGMLLSSSHIPAGRGAGADLFSLTTRQQMMRAQGFKSLAGRGVPRCGVIFGHHHNQPKLRVGAPAPLRSHTSQTPTLPYHPTQTGPARFGVYATLTPCRTSHPPPRSIYCYRFPSSPLRGPCLRLRGAQQPTAPPRQR